MFRSIFQRLLFTYAAIIIVVVVLLAALLTFFFKYYLFEQKQNQLMAAGRKAEEMAREYGTRINKREDLVQAVNMLGSVTDSRIYVLIDKKLAGVRTLDEAFGESGEGDWLLADIKRIMDGETVVREKEFSSQLNMYVVFVGLPVYINGAAGGVVLLFSPLDRLNRTLLEVYRIIWGTAAASLVLAAVIIYVLSRRISTPVEKIQKAAAAIAGGSFADDVVPVGKDEVAKLTATFNYMKNRLQQIEEMRKDLIANVSHELRTPLTTIRGFIQGILDGVIAPAEQEKYLRRAYNEAGRLNRLVDDLLQLARLQAGSVKLNRESVDIAGLVGEIEEEYRLVAERRNIALHCTCTGLPAGFPADRDKLKQILINLLQNAINYTPAGGEVSVSAAAASGKLIIVVADSGKGIPPEEVEFIFKKFHRVENTGEERPAGTGLGLSIARELVELHGGVITARSEAGAGTEITVEIPCASSQHS